MIAAVCAKEKNIAVLEASPRIGKKLLATGNGKCNLLNKTLSADFYNNADFAATIFKKYGFAELREFYEKSGLMLRFDEAGRGYPLSESSASVLEIMRRALDEKGVNIFTDTEVKSVSKNDGVFVLETSNGIFRAEKILIATGSDAGFGLDCTGLLKGLADVKPFACSLVPLCTPTGSIKGLNGVRVKCSAALVIEGEKIAEENGEVLFKTFGLSGIAVFNLSAAYARAGCPENAYVTLNFLERDFSGVRAAFQERLKGKEISAKNFLTGILHKMLISAVLNYAGVSEDKILNIDDIDKLAKAVTDFKISVIKTADKSLAQVSSGGVSTEMINKNTLESTRVKNLFFAGEAIDVDGLCGGYNLMWAAASAMTAAESL